MWFSSRVPFFEAKDFEGGGSSQSVLSFYHRSHSGSSLFSYNPFFLAVLQSHFAVNYGALCSLCYEYVGGGTERWRKRRWKYALKRLIILWVFKSAAAAAAPR